MKQKQKTKKKKHWNKNKIKENRVINKQTWHLRQQLQSRQVKRTPQDSIIELIIWKMNPLVDPVTGVKFKAAFLHA